MKLPPKTLMRVLSVPVREIDPSPFQPRSHFDEGEITALASSIRQNGLLQPVSVRRTQDGRYQLVAGERRLRACKRVGLDCIPAILCDYEDPQAAALGFLENVQRQQLTCFEQARGLRELLALWGCTQQEAAQRLGMSQPALANKLRLLTLGPQQETFCVQNGLTERHARAVLRLPETARTRALEQMARQNLNARQADELVERMLQKQPHRHTTPMVRDVRIFVNTINRAVRLMVEAGVPAEAEKREGEGCIEYVIRIPTQLP